MKIRIDEILHEKPFSHEEVTHVRVGVGVHPFRAAPALLRHVQLSEDKIATAVIFRILRQGGMLVCIATSGTLRFLRDAMMYNP